MLGEYQSTDAANDGFYDGEQRGASMAPEERRFRATTARDPELREKVAVRRRRGTSYRR